MKSSLAFAVLALAAQTEAAPDTTSVSFELFKRTFGKAYETDLHETKALSAFAASLDRIAARNAEEGTAVAGITQFSDLTPEEFKETYLTLKPSSFTLPSFNATESGCPAESLFPEHCASSFAADDFDWTTKGAVTGVKDQGQCGSCWAFGTTGDIEGVTFLKTGKLVSLSEQQLVSCEKTDDACPGGLQENAFKYIIKKGGLVTEKSYPYTSGGGVGGKCKTAKVKAPYAASISAWSQISKSKSGESTIMAQLAKVGPITIGINATPMQDYTSGIDNPKLCSPSQLDHAVLIVGYGTEGGVDYWKIKNSWATSWGEEGYYRIVRGVNKCGLANDAVHSSA